MKQPNFVLLALALTPPLVKAQDKVTFNDHIKPIFQSRCNNCHNPDKKRGGLDLTSYGALMQGGSGGAAADAGNSAGSRIWLCSTKKEEPFMPPEGDSLKPEELDMLAKWIDGGLLETASSVAKKSDKPKLEIVASSTGKPEGPPPMPEHLLIEPVLTTARPNSVVAMAASPWAPLLAVNGQRQIVLYDTNTGFLNAVLPFPEGVVQGLSFSRNGSLLVVAGGHAGKSGQVVLFDIKTGKRVSTIGDEVDTVLSADITADHATVAFGTAGKKVKAFDTSGTALYEISKHSEWVTAVKFSPDGVLLATGDRNGGLYIWEAATGAEYLTLEGHQGGITSISWSPDSNAVLSASDDKTVRLWEVNEGKEIRKWEPGGPGVLSASFSHDGNIVTSGRDRHVRVWKSDGTAIKDLGEWPDLPTQVAFDTDNSAVYAGDWSGEIKKISVESGAPSLVMTQNPPGIDARLTSLQAGVATLEGELKARTEEAAAAEAELEKKNAQFAETQTAHEALKGREQALPGEIQAAEAKRIDAEKSVADATQERDRLNKEKENYDNRTVEITAIEGDINRNNEQMTSLRAELAAAKAATPPDQAKVDTLTPNENALGQEITRLTQLLEQKKKERGESPDLAGAEARLAQANEASKSAAAELEGKKSELAELPQRIEDLRKRAEELPAQIEQWRNEQVSPKIAARDALTARRQVFSAEAVALKAGKFNVSVLAERARLDELISKQSDSTAIVEGAAQLIEQRTQGIAEGRTLITRVEAEMPAMEQTVTRLQAELQPLDEALKPLRQKVAEAQGRIDQLKARHPKLEQEVADAKADPAEARAARGVGEPLDAGDAALVELAGTRRALAAADTAVPETRAAAHAARAAWKDTAQSTLEKIKAAVSAQDQQLQDLKARLDSLNRQISGHPAEAGKTIDPAKAALNDITRSKKEIDSQLADLTRRLEARPAQMEKALAPHREKVRAATEKRDGLKKNSDDLQAKLAGNAEELEKQIAPIRTRLAEAEQALRDASAKLAEVEKAEAAGTAELTAAKASAEQEQKARDTEVAEKTATLEKLTAEAAAALDGLKAQRETLSAERTALTAQRDEARNRIGPFQNEAKEAAAPAPAESLPPEPSAQAWPGEDPVFADYVAVREAARAARKLAQENGEEQSRLRAAWPAQAEAAFAANAQKLAEAEAEYAKLAAQSDEEQKPFLAKQAEWNAAVSARDSAARQREEAMANLPKWEAEMVDARQQAEKAQSVLPALTEEIGSLKAKVDQMHATYLGMLQLKTEPAAESATPQGTQGAPAPEAPPAAAP